MTFKDVTLKNFRAHIRKYLSYFLCSGFSVMIFFMYSTIFFNDNLNNNKQVAKGALEALAVPTAALIIFSVIFISYAHSAFIKSRQQEFGLFMSLGMSTKQIVKIIIIENGLVGITSILSGIITGAVFSRLFFLVVLKVLQVSGIEFSIPTKSFSVTLGTFIAVFIVAILVSVVTAYRFQPVQLLKSRRISQRNKISNPIFALVGIITMVASIIAICISFASPSGIDGVSLLMLTVSCLIGLYITTSQLGGILLKLTKQRKALYYKNLMLITAIDHRFKQTKRIIFTTTIMVMVTTFYCGFMVYLLSSAEKQAVENNPFHIAFIQPRGKTNISESKLEDILAQGETELIDHKILEVINLKYLYNNIVQSHGKTVVSVDRLNEITGSNLHVRDGHYIKLRQISMKPEIGEGHYDKTDILFKSGDMNTNLKFQEAVYQICFNRFNYFYMDIVVLNNSDYKALKDKADISNLVDIHLMNFKDWHKTDPIVTLISEELVTQSITTSKDGLPVNRSVGEEIYFQTASRIGDYTYQKQGGSMLLFISGFLGLFFFIAASVILSFRLFSEIDDEREKYERLSSIGIRDCEVRKTINKELGLIFFIPVILGAILSFVYTFAFTRDGGQYAAVPLMFNLAISLLYLVFQTGYYFIVRRVYISKLI